MRRLWIADVHANCPAFEAVIADAGQCDEILFLGDIVGYGPHPSACVNLLQKIGARVVRGNHDSAVLAIGQRSGRRTDFVDWNEWTYDQLDPLQRSYVTAMPPEFITDCCGKHAKGMHHPAGAPYLHPDMPDSVLGQYVRPVAGTVLLCGHSHRKIDRVIGEGRFVCLPAVGQPRNGDPRAGYAIEERGRLDFKFVEYDVERTADDTAKIGLPDYFLGRWLQFLRTGKDAEWSRDYRP